MKSKLFMLLVVLVILVTVVGLGCLGGDNKNDTNNMRPEPINIDITDDNSPPIAGIVGSVSVVKGDNGPEPTIFITTAERSFSTSSIHIEIGQTVRIMNLEKTNFRHLFRSTNHAFGDFDLDPNYSATLTFSQPGTYEIQLLNHYTGESFGDMAPVMTVIVS